MKYEFHILELRNEEIYLFIYSPFVVKINVVHLVFLGIHEQGSQQARRLYLSIKLLTLCLALNITIKTLPNCNEMMQVYYFLEFVL